MIVFGIVLTLINASNVRAAAEDYLKELQLKQIDLMKFVVQFNIMTAKSVIDGSSTGNPTFALCLTNEASIISQLSLNIQNVSNLVAVNLIVSNSEEKRQIYPILQSSVGAARGIGQQLVQIFQQFGSLPSCQTNGLNVLSQSASAIAIDLDGTLAKMAE